MNDYYRSKSKIFKISLNYHFKYEILQNGLNYLVHNNKITSTTCY